jgi:hypothetical protein
MFDLVDRVVEGTAEAHHQASIEQTAATTYVSWQLTLCFVRFHFRVWDVEQSWRQDPNFQGRPRRHLHDIAMAEERETLNPKP